MLDALQSGVLVAEIEVTGQRYIVAATYWNAGSGINAITDGKIGFTGGPPSNLQFMDGCTFFVDRQQFERWLKPVAGAYETNAAAYQDKNAQSESPRDRTQSPSAASHNQKPRKRGPTPGTVDRYGKADRALYSEYEALLRPADPNIPAMSQSKASLHLAEQGKIKGVGSDESRAKRLRDRYRDDH
jgi:hypothetical protein